MLLFDAIASSLHPRRPALLPAALWPAVSSGLGRAWIPLAAALLGGALGCGALGCGSVVIEQDGSHASGGSAGGGAGAGGSPGTTGAGGGAVCPGGSWGHGFADSYKYEYGQSVAVDSGCHIVVSGSFGGEMDFGGVSISGVDEDLFVARFDPSGKPLWAQRFGTEPFQGSAFTAVDAKGNIALGGTYNGTLQVGDETLVAKQNGMFALALSPEGDALWARSFIGGNDSVLSRVAFAPDGGVLLAGYTTGGLLDLGQGPIGDPGWSTGFVAKLGPDGVTSWAVPLDGSGVRVTSVAAGADGQMWVTGRFQIKVQIGSFALEGTGGSIPFFAKLDASGGVLLAKAIPGEGSRVGNSVAVSPDGGALIAGDFDNTVDLGGGPLVVNGPYDGFVLSVDAAGNARWGVTFGGTGVDSIGGVAAAHDGGAWITGGFSHAIDFGATHIESKGLTDAFVARLDGEGKFTYARAFGGSSSGGDTGMSVAVDPDGNAFVTGTYMGTADLGSGPVTSAGLLDVYLAKVAAHEGP